MGMDTPADDNKVLKARTDGMADRRGYTRINDADKSGKIEQEQNM